MSKWSDAQGNEISAFKLCASRPMGCPPYESNKGDRHCEFYGIGFVKGGDWEGFLCLHPKAKGNKNGWLIVCPITQKATRLGL